MDEKIKYILYEICLAINTSQHSYYPIYPIIDLRKTWKLVILFDMISI